MFKRAWVYYLIVGLLLLAVGVGTLWSQRESSEPTTNNGQPWRLGYYEGGPFIDYGNGLRGTVNGLIELGWMEELDLPHYEDPRETEKLWDYLSSHVESPYIIFVPDAYWSSEWQEDQRERNRADAIGKLAAGEIDLVIAMGTWAGQDLATPEHDVPVLALTSSNTLEAGIIASPRDSGLDHVMGEYDPERYRRQIRFFHDVTRFDRLGVVYEDTPSGHIYANIDDLLLIAQERGFRIVVCHAPGTNVSEQEARRMVAHCYRTLAPQVDALWVGPHMGENPAFMPELLEPLFEHDVVTWSQIGEQAVERGVLLSVINGDFRETGRWYARQLARVLNGTRPRDLDPYYEIPYRIALNMETARRVNFEPPPGLLQLADLVYETHPQGGP